MALDFDLLSDSARHVMAKRELLRTRFYELMFEQAPELKGIVTADDRLMLGELFDRAVWALKHDRDNPDQLEEHLLGFGRKYRQSNLTSDHFTVIGEVLLATLEELLEERWTRNVEAAWDEAIGLTFALMGRAMEAAKASTSPAD